MSDLGNAISISMKTSGRDLRVPPLSIGVNGDPMGAMKAPVKEGNRRVDITYINPSPIVSMAYLGRGFYKEKIPLRALAAFPSWDRVAFAVSKDLKFKSLHDLARKKIPLRVPTRATRMRGRCTFPCIPALCGIKGRRAIYSSNGSCFSLLDFSATAVLVSAVDGSPG